MDLTVRFGLTPEKTLAKPGGSAKIPVRFSIAPAKMFPRVVGQPGFFPPLRVLLAPRLDGSPAIRRPTGKNSRVRGIEQDIHKKIVA